MSGFSLRKKAVGVYFNDKDVICSVQVLRGHEAEPNVKLIDAINGSRSLFFALYNPEPVPPALLRRARKIVADLETDQDRRNREAAKRLKKAKQP